MMAIAHVLALLAKLVHVAKGMSLQAFEALIVGGLFDYVGNDCIK